MACKSYISHREVRVKPVQQRPDCNRTVFSGLATRAHVVVVERRLLVNCRRIQLISRILFYNLLLWRL